MYKEMGCFDEANKSFLNVLKIFPLIFIFLNILKLFLKNIICPVKKKEKFVP
jgi:hypothetical protein